MGRKFLIAIIIILRLSIANHKSLIYDYDESMGLADHEVGHLFICLYFIQMLADQLVTALLLINKVQSATRYPHFFAQDPFQAVSVLHEHLLVM